MAKAERPDPTPMERVEDAMRRLFQVPKKEIDKAELRRKKEREAREADRDR